MKNKNKLLTRIGSYFGVARIRTKSIF